MGKFHVGEGMVTLFMALLTFPAVTFGTILGYTVGNYLGCDIDVAGSFGGALVAAFAVIALGGRDWLRVEAEPISQAFHFMWWIIVVSFALMTWDLYDYVVSGAVVAPDWIANVARMLVFSLAIGVSEECMFRGVLFGGMLAKFGRTKRGVVICVATSSIAFGCAHVVPTDFDLNNWLTIVQAMLKIIQTGIYAVMLCALMLRTRSLVGAVLMHALDDFLLFVVPFGLFGETFETDYVTESPDAAVPTIIFYLIVIALYLPTFIKAVRVLGRIEAPQYGPFVSEEAQLPAASLPPVPVDFEQTPAQAQAEEPVASQVEEPTTLQVEGGPSQPPVSPLS